MLRVLVGKLWFFFSCYLRATIHFLWLGIWHSRNIYILWIIIVPNIFKNIPQLPFEKSNKNSKKSFIISCHFCQNNFPTQIPKFDNRWAMWVNIGSMYKSWIQRLQEMARFVGPSTIWFKKLFQSYPELLPRIRPWHFLRKRTSGSYTLYASTSVLCLYCFFSLQCLFISACPNRTSVKHFMIFPGESIFTP